MSPNLTDAHIAKNNVWLNLPSTTILCPPRQICPQNALDIIRAVLAGGWTSRSLASHTFILSFSFHGSQKTEVPGYVFSVCVQPRAQHVTSEFRTEGGDIA